MFASIRVQAPSSGEPSPNGAAQEWQERPPRCISQKLERTVVDAGRSGGALISQSRCRSSRASSVRRQGRPGSWIAGYGSAKKLVGRQIAQRQRAIAGAISILKTEKGIEKSTGRRRGRRQRASNERVGRERVGMLENGKQLQGGNNGIEKRQKMCGAPSQRCHRWPAAMETVCHPQDAWWGLFCPLGRPLW